MSKRGFNLDKISSKLPYNEIWDTASPTPQERFWLKKEVLNQTFYYLGSGSQCYAFVSQDGKYVLKFFKMHKILPKKWLMDVSFSFLERYRYNNMAKKQNVCENFFKSFKDAYEQLREESGLVYLHLNKKRDLKKKVTVVGYDGEKFVVDLDSKHFAIQLKTKNLCDYLLELKENKNEAQAREVVQKLLQVIALRCKRGFGDRDPNVYNHFGMVNQKVIFMPCGHLFFDDTLKYPHSFQTEILYATEKMSQWAEQFYPELSILLQEEAEKIINTYFKEWNSCSSK